MRTGAGSINKVYWCRLFARAQSEMKENFVTIDGTIIGINRNSATVELANGSVVRGIISGRLMRHRIKIVVGDKVEVAPNRNVSAKCTECRCLAADM